MSALAPGGWLSPKALVTLLITLLLVVGEWSYGAVGGYGKLIVTLASCVGLEIALSLFLFGRRPPLQSAYITGVSLAILVRPQAALWWPFVLGPALAIGSKYVLRYRGRHLWNPSNLGIAVLVLLAPNTVAILSHEFGNSLSANAVIWAVGALVVTRARVLHISLTYVLSFSVLAAVRSAVVGTPLLAEIAPLTGPMYQLMALFMLTDPRTTVRSRTGRMRVVAVVALVEAVFRLGNDLDWAWCAPFAPAPPILALAIVGPLALLWDRRSSAREHGEQRPAPEGGRTPASPARS